MRSGCHWCIHAQSLCCRALVRQTKVARDLYGHSFLVRPEPREGGEGRRTTAATWRSPCNCTARSRFAPPAICFRLVTAPSSLRALAFSSEKPAKETAGQRNHGRTNFSLARSLSREKTCSDGRNESQGDSARLLPSARRERLVFRS